MFVLSDCCLLNYRKTHFNKGNSYLHVWERKVTWLEDRGWESFHIDTASLLSSLKPYSERLSLEVVSKRLLVVPDVSSVTLPSFLWLCPQEPGSPRERQDQTIPSVLTALRVSWNGHMCCIHLLKLIPVPQPVHHPRRTAENHFQVHYKPRPLSKTSSNVLSHFLMNGFQSVPIHRDTYFSSQSLGSLAVSTVGERTESKILRGMKSQIFNL